MLIKKIKITFLLLFLTALISNSVTVKAKSELLTNRLSGENRQQTSISISHSISSTTSNYAVLATEENFPDALSAAPLAKKYNAPILLSDPNIITKELKDEINRLNVKTMFIIGGYGAISLEIENNLKTFGINIIRISGKDRYQTSLAIANYLNKSNKVFIVTGDNFPDALSIASLSAKDEIPILLTEQNKPSDELLKYLNNNNIIKSYVIGGPLIISDYVTSKLHYPERIYGKNRYETNIAILNKFSSEFNLEKTYYATGENFPDALSGSVLASISSSPLVLVSNSPEDCTSSYILNNIKSIKSNYLLGGESVLPSTSISKLCNINTSTYLNIATYDGSNQSVHPKVLYFDNLLNGYKYWMAYTPYPYSNDDFENPSIAVSQDGYDWTEPLGLINPITYKPIDIIYGGHYSDPHLVMNSDTLELEMWYRYNKGSTSGDVNNSSDYIYRIKSKDGIHWSSPVLVYSDIEICLSPSIIYENGKYKMWYVTNKPYFRIRYNESFDGINWDTPKNVNMNFDMNYSPWHLDVIKTDIGYEMVVSCFYGNIFNNDRLLFYSKSNDEIKFNNSEIILTPSSNQMAWDNKQIYRSSLLKINNEYKLYYSAMDRNFKWHIGLLSGDSIKNLK